MADIFLSYKKEDRARIEALVGALQAEGFTVWFDYEIETGGDWFEQILEQLRAAPCVIGCWSNVCVKNGTFAKSSNSTRSYVLIEHREAGPKLLPVLLDPDAIPAEFGPLQAEDLTQWANDPSDPTWRKLIARIETMVAPTAPAWLRRRMAAHDATVAAERHRRQAGEERATALDAMLKEEAKHGAEKDRDLAVAHSRNSDLERRLNEFEAKGSEFSASKQGLESNVMELTIEKRTLQQRVDGLEAEKGSLQKDVAKFTAEVNGLKASNLVLEKHLELKEAQLNAAASEPISDAKQAEQPADPGHAPGSIRPSQLTPGPFQRVLGRHPIVTSACLVAFYFLLGLVPPLLPSFISDSEVLTLGIVAAAAVLLGAVWRLGFLDYNYDGTVFVHGPPFRFISPIVGAIAATLVVLVATGSTTREISGFADILAVSFAAFLTAGLACDRWGEASLQRITRLAILPLTLVLALAVFSIPQLIQFGGLTVDAVLALALVLAAWAGLDLMQQELEGGMLRVLSYAPAIIWAVLLGIFAGGYSDTITSGFLQWPSAILPLTGGAAPHWQSAIEDDLAARVIAVLVTYLVSLALGEILARFTLKARQPAG